LGSVAQVVRAHA